MPRGHRRLRSPRARHLLDPERRAFDQRRVALARIHEHLQLWPEVHHPDLGEEARPRQMRRVQAHRRRRGRAVGEQPGRERRDEQLVLQRDDEAVDLRRQNVR